MIRATLLLFGLLFGVLTERSSSRTFAGRLVDLTARIDSLIHAQVASDSFSGVVMVARNGVPVYQRAVGFADRDRHIPMRINTKIQIASTTKLFTRIAIRQLEQAAKLSLSDTMGKFLPNYPNAVVRRKVTVEQLLKHRSGVGSFWNEKYLATHANVRTVNDYLELFQNDSLLFEPGTSEVYSNGGYVLLGAIIERVSGKSYQNYVEEKIFRPAGMTETMPYDSRISRTNAAIGYTSQPLGGGMPGDRRLAGPAVRPGYEPPVQVTPDSRRTMRTPSGSGAVPSGAPRLRIMGPDGRELSPEEAREAMARRVASGGARRPNRDFQAGVSGPAGDHYSTVGDFLKLANALVSHRLLDSARTAAVLGARYAAGNDFRANGGGPGVNAEFSIYPTGDIIVVLSNYDPPAATTIAQYLRSLVAPSAAAAPAPRSRVFEPPSARGKFRFDGHARPDLAPLWSDPRFLALIKPRG